MRDRTETNLGYFQREQIREQPELYEGFRGATRIRSVPLTWCFASGPPGARTPLHGLKVPLDPVDSIPTRPFGYRFTLCQHAFSAHASPWASASPAGSVPNLSPRLA